MNQQKDIPGMLDLMIRPGFCVKENTIVKVNPAAQGLLIVPGMHVQELLLTGKEDYAAFSEGCLYLTLSLSGQTCGASVVRMGGYDIFLLEQESDNGELRSMALAARELREPLANIMNTASRLFPEDSLADEHTRQQVSHLNRGLYQMLRILSNMSDAGSCSTGSRQETRDICRILEEIFEKAQVLIAHTGIKLTYESLPENIYSLVDPEQLERSVLNILSNAVKFTPSGGTIDAELTRRGTMLQLSIQDSGSGIAENILSNVFYRYLRQPAIEDSRFGIGLGMVLIRSAAANHGGTVLIDQPNGKGTRITMTLAVRQNPDNQFRSHILHVDYAGERDHSLVELSECLPPHLYEV